ncbi:hypothetical protein [Mucilaginibacter pocheonensis]|uniref:Lipoprotein n=1 Tax=Mucilaginibacter pocheonensis TaxID=398050 RepID=A0ABU1T9A9_9SPHI|nr:hypothetical protein [Mucilaginibacter pocheonensis]MDR6941446.1 hypothetical protein [Mucilaginibacter pocheonensis]
MKTPQLSLKLLLPLFLLFSCSPTISTFDQTAYMQVTSLKVDALNLMDKATESYTAHESEVKTIQLAIDKAIEYDKHRPHNEITINMWTILNNPEGHLFGGFLVKWKKEGKCNEVYIVDKKKQIGNSFDQIAELESKKTKPSEVTK